MMNHLRRILPFARTYLDRPGYRHLPAIVATLVALAILLFAIRLPADLQRSRVRVAESAACLKSVQDNLGEIDSLKARAVSPALGGKGLQEAVATSLTTRLPSLSATLVDGNNVRVQGTAGFDAVVQWLAEVQGNHRLAVKTLAVTRQGNSVAVDVTLSAADE